MSLNRIYYTTSVYHKLERTEYRARVEDIELSIGRIDVDSIPEHINTEVYLVDIIGVYEIEWKILTKVCECGKVLSKYHLFNREWRIGQYEKERL